MWFQRPPRGLRGPRPLWREFPGRLRGARTQYRSITDESYPAYLTAPCAGPAGCLHAAAPVAPVQSAAPVAHVLPAAQSAPVLPAAPVRPVGPVLPVLCAGPARPAALGSCSHGALARAGLRAALGVRLSGGRSSCTSPPAGCLPCTGQRPFGGVRRAAGGPVFGVACGYGCVGLCGYALGRLSPASGADTLGRRGPHG